MVRRIKSTVAPVEDAADDPQQELLDKEVSLTTEEAPVLKRKLKRRQTHAPPTQKRRRQCDCGTAEACFACGRCMEQHCVCGAAERAGDQLLCHESCACNCRLLAPTVSRCVLCMGCRKPSAAHSHCRCVQHQELRRQLAQDNKTKSEVAAAANGGGHCRCFDRNGAVDLEQQQQRRKRLSLIQRRAGISSSQGLFQKKVVFALGDFGESDIEEDVTDDVVANGGSTIVRTSAEELEDTVHPAILMSSRPLVDDFIPQHPIEWGRSKSFQSSIAQIPQSIGDTTFQTRDTSGRDQTTSQKARMDAINRALDNVSYAIGREQAMPPEELVDYLVLAASVKASRTPELVGSLDDTAATALGIVVQEYVRQLVQRSDRQPPCNSTTGVVQDFTVMVLRDFNYSLFLQKLSLPPLPLLSAEQTELVTNELTQLVFDEFLAVQRPMDRGGFKAPPRKTPLCDQIRKVVASELAAVSGLAAAMEASPLPSPLSSTSDDHQFLKAAKLTQRTSKLTGQLVYKYDVAATIGDKHRAQVTLDGFESRHRAERSLQSIRKVLEVQHKRITKIEHPSPLSKVEDPIVDELYEQLLNQVKQTRPPPSNPATTVPTATSTPMVHPSPSPNATIVAAPVPKRAQKEKLLRPSPKKTTTKSKKYMDSDESSDDEDSNDSPPPKPRRTAKRSTASRANA